MHFERCASFNHTGKDREFHQNRKNHQANNKDIGIYAAAVAALAETLLLVAEILLRVAETLLLVAERQHQVVDLGWYLRAVSRSGIGIHHPF